MFWCMWVWSHSSLFLGGAPLATADLSPGGGGGGGGVPTPFGGACIDLDWVLQIFSE